MPNNPAPSRSCSRKIYSVIIFNDDSAVPLNEHMLRSHPRREARRRGGARGRVLLSEEGFEAVVGHPPQPRHRATEEHGPVGP
jgi:hypothetical protein